MDTATPLGLCMNCPVRTILRVACRGVLFAITQDEAQRLRAARGQDTKVLSIVQDEIEDAWDEAHLCQTDKAGMRSIVASTAVGS